MKNSWEENADGVLCHQGLLYVPKIVTIELISKYHDDLLASHFGIDKTRELIARKYYWLTLRKDVKAYAINCDVCLALKAVRHKPYSNLQSLTVLTLRSKDLSIDFVTGILVFTYWKRDTYDSILVIVDPLTKIIHYKPVKVTIYTLDFVEVILDVLI